jgi:hypothetical protein
VEVGKMVRQLSKAEIKEIYGQLEITNHARKRMIERGADITDFLKSNFAYVNVDGSINVAVNDYEYIVVVKKPDCYLIITYKEPSKNGITIGQKYMIALNGRQRVNKGAL